MDIKDALALLGGSGFSCQELDLAATIILDEDRRAYKRKYNHAGPIYGILSDDQMKVRGDHEVLTDPKTFEQFYRPGVYGRAYNPEMNRRPKGKSEFGGDPEHDARVGMGGNHKGGGGDLLPFRDPLFASPPRYGYHLDKYQRCRIRRVLRNVPRGHAYHRLRHLTRTVLAAHYGVPLAAIIRLE